MSSRCAAHRNFVPSALSSGSGYCVLLCPKSGDGRTWCAASAAREARGCWRVRRFPFNWWSCEMKRFSPLCKSTEVSVSTPLVQRWTLTREHISRSCIHFGNHGSVRNRDVGCTRRFMYTHCCTLNACTPSDRQTEKSRRTSQQNPTESCTCSGAAVNSSSIKMLAIKKVSRAETTQPVASFK